MAVKMMELDRVSKRFDDFVAVDDLSLTISKGEFIALMGPSGCGKTTTLRMIAGLERPTDGEIRLWDRRINEDDAWERDAPLVWQNYALFPFMSVQRNVEFGLKQRGIAPAIRGKKAKDWLERLGIGALADRSVDQLSGGQKQRVALARALVLEPEMLLLDEPLSALDPHLRVRMQAELVRLHRELGITFVYITHHQSEAFAMADRVAIMNGGRILQIGDPRALYRRPSSRFVAEFIGGNSIMAGQFTSVGDGIGTITNAAGTFRAAVESAPAGDAEAYLVVPGDQITLSGDLQGTGNEIPVRVAALELVGASANLLLESEHGQELQMHCPLRTTEDEKMRVGQKAIARWPHDAGFILAS